MFSAYHIFRAYDIRGIVGKDLTPDVMEKIGLALGKLMDEKSLGTTILVGRDVRKSSSELEEMFIKGLVRAGINVLHVGEASASLTLFSGWRLGADVTAYITASHLPKQWNGVKFYTGEGVGFPEDSNKRIGEIVAKAEFQERPGGNVKDVDIENDYVKFMNTSFSVKKGMKVAVDCGNASMCLSAPRVLEEAGLKVTDLFCKVDPSFPSRDIDPKPENITELCRTVKEDNADFGVAFDGDGDRAAIVDELGRALTADQTGIILAKGIIQEQGPGTILANLECSMVFEKLLEPLGAKISRIPVGHTFLTLEAKKQKAILGVESSGHIVMPKYFLFDDGMFIPLKIAEILNKSGRRLSEMVDEIPTYPKKRLNFDCPDKTKFQVIEKLQERLPKEYENALTIDGLRIETDKGWVLIRASNTSPAIRITAEAETEKDLQNLLDKFSAELRKVIPEL